LILFVLAYFLSSTLLTAVFAQGEGTTETETPAEAAPAEAAAVEEAAPEINNLDTVWILFTGSLVFFMQAGFALVEAGFVRAKVVVNIMMKNLFDFAVGSIAFWAVGFGIMFGSGNAFFGTEWFFLQGLPEVYPGLTIPSYAFFFFQFVFAATAATIASGAMAGRTEFKGYLIYSFLVTLLVYPIVGHWIWGGGWLAQRDTPFLDFAGSTVVHSVGGWIGLTGAIILGPRLNRFGPDGIPMPGHSMTLATLGTFILWLGWFGFNPGSQLNADGAAISLVTVTTNLAAAAGAITAMFVGWFLNGKPQLPWALNGALAGLVGITAPCAFVTPAEAVLIGMVAGIIMYAGVNLLERLKIDDVVGAVSVHGFAGVWGTLAVGLFHGEKGLLHGGGADQLVTQIIGIVAVAAFSIIASAIIFLALKAIGWLRATREGELLGLDIYEHGQVAYPEFTTSPSEPVARKK
ncbi:MAG: ammonium transporter, partial [Anaerolinea sp.]|nr:ammonium transporter [Anaerolinea sp.]